MSAKDTRLGQLEGKFGVPAREYLTARDLNFLPLSKDVNWFDWKASIAHGVYRVSRKNAILPFSHYYFNSLSNIKMTSWLKRMISYR